MKKYLKTFAAVLMVFSGTIATAKFFLEPISYVNTFYGLIGLLILYPTIESYRKMFDNLFGK